MVGGSRAAADDTASGGSAGSAGTGACPKQAFGLDQTQFWDSGIPKALKSLPGQGLARGSPMGAKGTPKGTQREPKVTPEEPKKPKVGPKGFQRTAKGSPKSPQGNKRDVKVAPKGAKGAQSRPKGSHRHAKDTHGKPEGQDIHLKLPINRTAAVMLDCGKNERPVRQGSLSCVVFYIKS